MNAKATIENANTNVGYVSIYEFDFEQAKLDFWKKWIIENKNVNKIDYHLEEELVQTNKNKSR